MPSVSNILFSDRRYFLCFTRPRCS